MSPLRVTAALLALLLLAGCTYIRFLGVQEDYRERHGRAPTLWLSKHLLDTATFLVYGRLIDPASPGERHSLTVVALSSRHRQDEIVEVNRLGKAGSYYGMNLPRGDYRLLVLADLDGDGVHRGTEVVGERHISLAEREAPQRVAGGIDITIGPPYEAQIAALDGLAALAEQPRAESLFFPRGALRSLDDPIFAEGMRALGMYDPAAFVEAAPTMFYALEEDRGHKVPVIFVHGMGGSPRDFAAIVERLDRERYKPWFFYYPSGLDLEPLSRLFYDIFLSGSVVPGGDMPAVVVAHSMGGLVVRQALNRYGGGPGETKLGMIVTIAAPFGGHPGARSGVERAPLVVPAWRDLDPASAFVAGLFARPLPDSLPHHVLYAYRDTSDPRRGTDGVVSIASQLPARARFAGGTTHGFRSSHAGILSDGAAVAKVAELVAQVKAPIPDEHMAYLLQGGFEVPLGPAYTEMGRYLIRTYGRYLAAVAAGELAPLDAEQARFARVARDEAPPRTELEAAWVRFRADYPALAGRN